MNLLEKPDVSANGGIHADGCRAFLYLGWHNRFDPVHAQHCDGRSSCAGKLFQSHAVPASWASLCGDPCSRPPSSLWNEHQGGLRGEWLCSSSAQRTGAFPRPDLGSHVNRRGPRYAPATARVRLSVQRQVPEQTCLRASHRTQPAPRATVAWACWKPRRWLS